MRQLGLVLCFRALMRFAKGKACALEHADCGISVLRRRGSGCFRGAFLLGAVGPLRPLFALAFAFACCLYGNTAACGSFQTGPCRGVCGVSAWSGLPACRFGTPRSGVFAFHASDFFLDKFRRVRAGHLAGMFCFHGVARKHGMSEIFCQGAHRCVRCGVCCRLLP